MAKRPTTRNTSRLHTGAMAMTAALALAAIAAAPASATTTPSSRPAAFALSPVGSAGALLLRGAPGRTLRGAVLVRNVSRHSITVRLHAADIRNASNGNADYVTAGLARAGRWLHLGARTVRLAPHAARRVSFTVRIPAGARGASHYAGIVAINAADLTSARTRNPAKGQTFTFKRINRQALPLTIRLPGPLFRRLALRSVRLIVQPVGAGLELGLLPGGSELIQSARIRLHVLRGTHTTFTYASTLGQLFPDAGLNYRIPWKGRRPTLGTYRVLGTIRPRGAAVIHIDTTIRFTAAKGKELTHETPAVAHPTVPGIPAWVWIALAGGAALLIALSLSVWKLARRPGNAAA
jgi:hypothetical protein